ncbi:PREDICTED: small VCP/p97-interacting protein [Trachymyrmex septentrionalis]|uniref:small VCP/p97-interacting protein n=1 Tax=Trachymyrmex septentrionalis TaxID=34720 RepID=UPI00084EDA75|nr:PREDICTED: small VCP/p97-interacting protein [Trachymyrmex septentrionalis]
MGNCCACFKGTASYEDLTPDRETIRRRQAEAAEKRIAEQQQRGIKDVESVKRQQRRAMELEKREQEAAASGTQPALRWQVN